MVTPIISVVIPAYNAEQWIAAALNSVLIQQMAGLEIIVVDDGSTDATAAVVRNTVSTATLIQTENGGPSRARNVGTQAASGHYIQYLDADDLLCAGKLAGQHALLEATGADIAYGDWQYICADANGSYVLGETIRQQLTDGPDMEPDVAVVRGFFCPPNTYLFRREIIDRVGGWNEAVPVIQDVRLIQDCAMLGARFVYQPGLMAQYRKHGSNTVSTRNPVAFNRDCLKNAVDIEAWWRQHGGLSAQRQAALLVAYGYVARATFLTDAPTFDTALAALQRLSPGGGYIPPQPRHLKLASQMIGYRRAETVAALYRRVKRRLRAYPGSPHP